MTIEQIADRIIERAKELLKMPEVQAIYQSKENEADAKEWVMNQALITLMYSHEERMEMMNKKLAIN